MEAPLPPPIGKCVQHPYLQGIGRCQICRAWVCPTCDFIQPHGDHVCPECAVKSGSEATGGQRMLLIWAYVLAVWSSVLFVMLLSGGLAGFFQDPEVAGLVGILLMWMILAPAITGVGLAAGAERRRYKPMSVTIAFFWNWLNVGGMLLLVVSTALLG